MQLRVISVCIISALILQKALPTEPVWRHSWQQLTGHLLTEQCNWFMYFIILFSNWLIIKCIVSVQQDEKYSESDQQSQTNYYINVFLLENKINLEVSNFFSSRKFQMCKIMIFSCKICFGKIHLCTWIQQSLCRHFYYDLFYNNDYLASQEFSGSILRFFRSYCSFILIV